MILGFFSAVGPAQTRVPEQLTLQDALQLLSEQNPLLQAERMNRDLEEIDVAAARRFPNPSFEFASQGLGSDGPNGFLNDQELSFLLEQEFPMGGRRQKQEALERVDVEIAESQFQNRLQLLRFSLKEAYYQLILAQKDHLVSREILEDFQGVTRLNRIRFENGEISGGELRRVEAAQYTFYEDLVGAEVAIENAQDALLAVLGFSDFQQGLVATDDFDPSFLPPSLLELREIALRERRDLASRRAFLVRVQLQLDVEQARRTPNLTAFGGYRRDFGADGAIVGLQIPLFVFNRNEAGIARAQVSQRQGEHRIREAEVQVLRQVAVASNELAGHRKRIQALEGEYLQKAERSRDIAESTYRLGNTPLTEFLEAERTYREISRRYNQALYDYQLSRARLELAVAQDF
jgi:cobalt-zinc-cadmium efflux system outer membrane protein